MATKPRDNLPTLAQLYRKLWKKGEPLTSRIEPGKQPSWCVLNGSFIDLLAEVPDNYFDAVIADPPYNTGALPLYWHTWALSARLLRPGGYLTMIMPTYCQDPFASTVHEGPIALALLKQLRDEEMELQLTAIKGAAKALRYRWTIGMLQLTGSQARLVNAERNLRVSWKPVGWWIKQPSPDRIYTEVLDTFDSTEPSKASHRWKQSAEWARYNCRLIAPLHELTLANLGRPARILDPMVGTGTLPYIATREFGYQVVSCDIDPRAFALTVEALSGQVQGQANRATRQGQRALWTEE